MPGTPAVGTREHRDLFCKFFVQSYVHFDPDNMPWPRLEGSALERLTSLPFWGEAVSTERVTARTVQSAALRESDPVVRDALAMQGAEEGRHSRLLRSLVAFYGIDLPDLPPLPDQNDMDREFLHAGFGECFDSFFAFGLIRIAKESGYFAPELVEIFEPIMQEEARHILFFINWVAYHRAQLPWWKRPLFRIQCASVMALQLLSRIKTARGMNEGENFTMKGHEEINADITPRGFLEICLEENQRRFSRYDARLLHPKFAPGIAKLALKLLPRQRE
ncbi:MAG: ferritin-like domain-containing protein [Gammaproteobacteria bacterium]|nr:ferritin-like domain-containing protein [Gammaproteobacteria bacterium]